MSTIGALFRPPSEAYSGLLQITTGCSHNRCAFCAMYRDKQFRAKPWLEIDAEIHALSLRRPRRIFLCDGDALILSTQRLLKILEGIHARMPWVERVSSYGDARGILSKPITELRALRAAGLSLIYHGAESGDDAVLARMNKGSTAAEAIEAAARLKAAGIGHSVMVLLGLGGVEGGPAHARATARLLTEMDPAYVGALTLMLVPGTPLHAEAQAGRFVLPDKWACLRELRILIDESRLSGCRFSSNHASNDLPLKLTLPEDRQRALEALDAILKGRDASQLRPEWLKGL
ncbi:radical SAM protein [Myxococcota bacterium]|nr:radical SAM protein [Myxococcota bacterium]MBU1430221.1 radical SAM protein [Myxococcota bacterium]MBU1896717.1 radical SAM protein [Myxococcota bacterium]